MSVTFTIADEGVGGAPGSGGGPGPRTGRLGEVDGGRPAPSPWERPALAGILAVAAALYLTSLDVSGWANGYYSAAVQAGAHSWRAAFFGSLDPSGFITVDKPPAALWLMDLSARVLGFSSWSVLLPQAIEGLAAVWLLHITVRRVFGPAAGLLAAGLLAVTPVATLMFRFNDPDPLLTALLTGATYCVIRALEPAGRSGRWTALAGGLIGLGFITKMGQALLVVPVLAGVSLYAGPGRLRARLGRLLVAGAVMVAAAGWWVAAVVLTPSGSRPYIGSTQTNDLMELITGYNGLGRLTGSEAGVGPATSTSYGAGGPAGFLRLFDAQFRGQIGWLLPAALIGAGAALWLTRRSGRTDPARASVLIWSGTLVLTGATISLGRGMVHPYYSLALAPAVAALVAIGACMLWKHRDRPGGRRALSAGMAVTLVWAAWIVSGGPPWSRPAAAAADLVVAGGSVWLGRALARPGRGPDRPVLVAGLLCLLGPVGVSVATAATAHHDAIPMAGVTAAPLPQRLSDIGDVLTAGQPSPRLVSTIDAGPDTWRWAVATVGGERAAGLQLATRRPVMAIGGFNGTDPAPTLDAFEACVRAGAVHWFVDGAGVTGDRAPGPAGTEAAGITSWVESHFPARTVGPVTLYDLSP